MGAISWTLQADLDGDTTYEADLTGYVERPGAGIRLDRLIGTDGTYRVAKFDVQLSNRGGEFTPENRSSAFYGRLVPDVPVRLLASHNGNDYTVFTGYAQRWRTSWRAGGVSLCTVTCVDLAWYLQRGAPVDVVASTSRDTDGALAAIAQAAALEPADYSFEDGVQDLAVHFAVGANPYSAMQDVADSEAFGWLYVDALGLLRFRGRRSLLGVSPDDTWGDGTGIYPQQPSYDVDPEEYATAVRVRGIRPAIGADDVVVQQWSVGTNRGLHLTSGQVYEREFAAESATVSLETPVATTDYLANAANDGSGADRTSSLTVTLTSLGGGRYRVRLVAAAELYVLAFRVRGQPVALYPDRPEVNVSKVWPGGRTGQAIDVDLPWVSGDSPIIRDYAVQQLRVLRYPPARVALAFDQVARGDADDDDAIKDALLSLELLDLIRYADTDLPASSSPQLDDWWRVVGISMAVPPDMAGASFSAAVQLERSYDYRDLDHIAYDDFDRGNGSLGTSTSGDAWANAGGVAVSSLAAVPSSAAAQVPNIDLGASDMVVELTVAPSNLIANPGFEANADGWSAAGSNTVVRTTDLTRGDSAGAGLCTYGNGVAGDSNCGAVQVTLAGASAHGIGLWMYIPEAYTGGAPVVQAEGFTSATGTASAAASLSVRDAWQWVGFAGFVPDAGDLSGAIVVRLPDAADGDAIYIDDAFVSNAEAGVVFRLDDTSNYWRFYVDAGEALATLESVESGSVDVSASAAWRPNGSAELRVICQSDRIRCWVDRVLAGAHDIVEGTFVSETRAGMFARGSTTTRLEDWYAQGV